MKKIILLLFCLFSLQVNSFAQGGGDLQITNLTDCPVTWNVVALCPHANPCTEYSTGVMNLLSASASVSYIYGTYPWMTPPGAPACPDWQWAYAWVGCGSGGKNPVKVGYYDCSGPLGPTQWKVALCDCNGKTVYATFNYNGFGLTNLLFSY